MMRRWLALFALALPVLGLSVSVAWHWWQQSDAREWRIPVTGYDPRDLLAGHYARFRFAWKVEGQCPDGNCVFCLEDRTGVVTARVERKDAQCAYPVDPATSGISVVWMTAGSNGSAEATGRIYIAEREAARITRMLGQDNGAILVARSARGRLTGERLEPGP